MNFSWTPLKLSGKFILFIRENGHLNFCLPESSNPILKFFFLLQQQRYPEPATLRPPSSDAQQGERGGHRLGVTPGFIE